LYCWFKAINHGFISRQDCMAVLHVASWYPNPWDDVEGNFVREQVQLFGKEIPARVIVVQVRASKRLWPQLLRLVLDGGVYGYFLLAPVRPGKITEWLSAILIMFVLLRERAWRFDALHFHIAYPLLLYTAAWRWWFRRPIIVSEHWSAYHYNFHLKEGAPGLRRLRKPFQQGFPVLTVSNALLDDIRTFARTDDIRGFVVPNIVPLHGAISRDGINTTPVFFAVNRWVPIKNPIPMLLGLSRIAEAGENFKLVIGGYGPLLDSIVELVKTTALRENTVFLGKMTKQQIADQLEQTDGYLFSSDYETFSVACAEALGSGVPLIGPNIPAIAEYAGPEDWVVVSERTSDGWYEAISKFLQLRSEGRWDHFAIAQRASEKFQENSIRQRYRDVMVTLGLGSRS
jgi:L-malate glycosyltransferase